MGYSLKEMAEDWVCSWIEETNTGCYLTGRLDDAHESLLALLQEVASEERERLGRDVSEDRFRVKAVGCKGEKAAWLERKLLSRVKARPHTLPELVDYFGDERAVRTLVQRLVESGPLVFDKEMCLRVDTSSAETEET